MVALAVLVAGGISLTLSTSGLATLVAIGCSIAANTFIGGGIQGGLQAINLESLKMAVISRNISRVYASVVFQQPGF